jgi:uncharacterized protein YjbI with pentapeptide repeats
LVGGQAQDFSGLDFRDLALHDQNFFESIFNGCTFSGVRASQSVFQHTEFTETWFQDCTFELTSFDHADIVLAEVQDCIFTRCSFQNGEWRDVLFRGVSFQQCIFRNTTTSLIRFVECSFDEASAASFVGTSKSFVLFSRTLFRLPPEHSEFLRRNYGLVGSATPSVDESSTGDPLFDLSLAQYRGVLSSESFYRHVTQALSELVSGRQSQRRLDLRYVSEICKLWLDEDRLSVLAIHLLDVAASGLATSTDDRDQALELISLVFSLRLALRQRVVAIDAQVRRIEAGPYSQMRLKLEFENAYTRDRINAYLDQLGAYCSVSRGAIVLEHFGAGSTIVEVLLATLVPVADVFRFIKYSLSLATVTIHQVGKLKRAYSDLVGRPRRPRALAKPSRRSPALAHKGDVVVSPATVAGEMLGARPTGCGPIEIVVDTARERVLVVEGRVKVTILLT